MEEKYLLALFVVVVALSFLFTSGGNISGRAVDDCVVEGQEAVVNEMDSQLYAGTYKVCENHKWRFYSCDRAERAYLSHGSEVNCIANEVTPWS